MAPVLHSTNSFLRNSACIASLLLITMLGIGCVGDIQKKTIPGLSLSASSFNFQTVIVGQKATQTFQISNTGTASLQISAPSVSNPEFSITGPSAPLTVNGSSVLLTLLPAHSFSYTLTFAPTTPGSATATVNLATSAASQPVSISLSGNGEKGYANLLVTPTVVSFGNLALKSTSTQNVSSKTPEISALPCKASRFLGRVLVTRIFPRVTRLRQIRKSPFRSGSLPKSLALLRLPFLF